MIARHEVVVQSTGEIVALSQDAYEALQKPVPIMPFVEDIYTVTGTGKSVPQRWYVIFVRPTHGCADRVDRYGKRFGFRSYWPKRIRLAARGKGQYRKSVPVEAPLMNRYVLMRLPAEKPPFGLLTSHEGKFNGVCGFLGNSQGPICVPDELVQRLIAREESGEFNDTVKRGKRVITKLPAWAAVNELVAVKSGPFASFHGIVEEHLPTGKIKVGMMLFGRAAPVEMHLEQLHAVGY